VQHLRQSLPSNPLNELVPAAPVIQKDGPLMHESHSATLASLMHAKVVCSETLLIKVRPEIHHSRRLLPDTQQLAFVQAKLSCLDGLDNTAICCVTDDTSKRNFHMTLAVKLVTA
jgi:hypothetical protein